MQSTTPAKTQDIDILRDMRYLVLSAVKLLQNKGQLSQKIKLDKVSVTIPKNTQHGDITTNVVIIISNQISKPMQEVAQPIIEQLTKNISHVEKIFMSIQGFINIKYKKEFWHKQVEQILTHKETYGNNNIGQGKCVNVEHVSANPTGPLQVSALRGGIVGDSIANVLKKCGYIVTTEYYNNNRGNQIKLLAESVYDQYVKIAGEDSQLPIATAAYPGEYVKDIAQQIYEQNGKKFIKCNPEKWLSFFSKTSVSLLISDIKQDLKDSGIIHDIFTSEQELYDNKWIDRTIEYLEQKNLLYTGTVSQPKSAKGQQNWTKKQKNLILCRTSKHGDKEDKVIRKESGEYTYFIGDVAYMLYKKSRKYDWIIYVLGADHQEYSCSLKAIADILKISKISILISQMIHVFDAGIKQKISKRSGNLLTFKEVIKNIGKDAMKLIFLMKSHNVTHEFDLKQVTENNDKNPSFYMLYAYTRCCSIQRQAPELLKTNIPNLKNAKLHLLTKDEEIDLIRCMIKFPSIIKQVANNLEPHYLAFYSYDLAKKLHTLWSVGKKNPELRVLNPDNDVELSLSRLKLIQAVQIILKQCLHLMGVTPLETM